MADRDPLDTPGYVWPPTMEDFDRQVDAAVTKYHDLVMKLTPPHVIALHRCLSERLGIIKAEADAEDRKRAAREFVQRRTAGTRIGR